MPWFQNRTRSTPDDLSQEMAQHLEERIEALMESGVSRREAIVTARKAFGNQALLQDRSYEVWQSRFVEPIFRDLRYAWKQLRRSPVFTISAVVILGLGIAANTAVSTMIYAITQRELPVYRPAELASVGLAFPKTPSMASTASYPMYEQLAQRQHSFTGLAAWAGTGITMLDEYGDLRSQSAMLVTGNFFAQLGLHPALGRMLTEADDLHPDSGAPWPVVLEYSFWKQNFHKDRDIISKTITISQSPAVVVGIADPSFDGMVFGTAMQAFLPVQFLADHNDSRSADPLHDPTVVRFHAFGRLKPGVSLEEADKEINGYSNDLLPQELIEKMLPERMWPGASLHAVSGRRFTYSILREFTGPLTSLQAIMATVLFLCCFNVTGLQLARVAARRHEFSVRIALGATRGHLVRQSLVEASILSLGGAMLGAPIAWGATRALSSFLTHPGQAVSAFIEPDWTVFAFAGAVAAFVTLLVGIFPALVAGGTTPGSVLRAKASLQRTPVLAGRILVPLQIALSFLLVMVTGLLLATLVHLRGQDDGYNIRNVAEAYTQLWRMKITPEVTLELYHKIVDQLRTEPGMEGAGATWITPLMGALSSATVRRSGTAAPIPMDFNQVGPGYFETLDIARLSGRDFQDDDTERNVCIVNRSAEQVLYHGRDALGGEPLVSAINPAFQVMCRIVGVVQDTRYADLRGPEKPTVYLPITTETLVQNRVPQSMVILMRSKDHRAAEEGYRRVMAAFAPTTPIPVVFPLRAQKNEALGRENLLTLMSVLFGGFALPLCCVGMFGLLAVRVEQLTTEFVLRLTFGATRMQILGLVLRESLSLLATGLLAGVPLLLAVAVLTLAAVDKFLHIPAIDFVTNFLQHFLHATTRLDFYNALGTLILLTLVAVTAGLLPGWRASRLEPIEVLRRE